MAARRVTVSILIPTYNRASYLRDAIGSALAQTCADIEVVVLDDASTDATQAVVAAFADEPRLRYVRHARNVGIADNWRAGIASCAGEFFCLLHDDDTLEPEFVSLLLPPLQADADLVLAFSDHWCMDAQARRLPESTEAARKRFGRDRLAPGQLTDFARTALVDAGIPVGATLFRRAMVTPDMIDARARGSIDMWLLYGCWQTGKGAYYVPSRLMNYREHSGGMSGSQPLYMAEGHLFRYAQMLNDPGLRGIYADLKGLRARMLRDYGIGLMAVGRIAESRAALRESLRLQFERRALMAYTLSRLGRSGKFLAEQARRRADRT